MIKKQIEKFLHKIDIRIEALGKERDILDTLMGEIEALGSDANEALTALEEARKALSRLT